MSEKDVILCSCKWPPKERRERDGHNAVLAAAGRVVNPRRTGVDSSSREVKIALSHADVHGHKRRLILTDADI